MNSALTTPLIVGLFVLMALRPPMPQRSSPFNLQFALGYLINEQPFLGLWWLLSGTLATLLHPAFPSWQWWLIVGLTVTDAAMLAALALRARSARPVLSGALHAAFGVDMEPRVTRPSWWRVVLVPVVSWRPDVRRIRNIRYGPAGRANRLDVYVSRRGVRTAAPVLVYLHGGAFRMGSKSLGAHPLLYRLAAEGWVCISADYRLFRARYSDQLHDAHAVLELDARPRRTPTAATRTRSWSPAAPQVRTWQQPPPSPEPPFAVSSPSTATSGTLDIRQERSPPHTTTSTHRPRRSSSFTAPRTPWCFAEDARAFADRLRAVSRQPVAYAELPRAQHNFDFFHSLRFHSVTDAVADFAALTTGPTLRRSAASRST